MQDSFNKSTRKSLSISATQPILNWTSHGRTLETGIMKTVSFITALLACLITAGAFAAAPPQPTRDATYVEKVYIGFALDQKNSDICAKISPTALETDRWQMKGRQIFYTRSSCFMQVALMLQKLPLCGAVVPAQDTFFLTGWYYSQKNCERMAKAEKPIIPAFAIDYEIVMKSLGYIESERNGRSWSKFYQDIRSNQDKSLQSRIDKLPDFSKAVAVDPSELLK